MKTKSDALYLLGVVEVNGGHAGRTYSFMQESWPLILTLKY